MHRSSLRGSRLNVHTISRPHAVLQSPICERAGKGLPRRAAPVVHTEKPFLSLLGSSYDPVIITEVAVVGIGGLAHGEYVYASQALFIEIGKVSIQLEALDRAENMQDPSRIAGNGDVKC